MDQTFKFSRWWMLVSAHWAQNRKRYLLALAAIGGLLLAWYSFILTMDKYNPMDTSLQYLTYYFGLYFIGCLYASFLFSELGGKAEGIQYLSIPASHLEKLACALFFGVVLFFIAYTLLFYIVDIPMVRIANRLNSTDTVVFERMRMDIGPVHVKDMFAGRVEFSRDIEYRFVILAYFAIQSVFILGSVYFTRYSFLKTIVTILFFALVFNLFFSKLIDGNLPAGWRTDTPLSWRQNTGDGGEARRIGLPDWVGQTIGFLIEYSIPLIFWWITWQRLKEKEV